MKRKILVLITLSFLVMGVVSAASLWGTYKGNQILHVKVDGTVYKSTGVPPIIYNGQAMLPITALKQLGVNYSWDAKSQTADIKSTTGINDIVQQISNLGGYAFSLDDSNNNFNASAQFMIVPEIDKAPNPLSKMPVFKKILYQLSRTGAQYVTVYCVVSPPFSSDMTDYKTIGHIQVLSSVIQQYTAGKVNDDYLNSHWSIRGFDSETDQDSSTGATGSKMTAKDIAKLMDRVGYVESYDESGNSFASGSGFLLQGGMFITNHHVVESSSGIKIKLDGVNYNTPYYWFDNKDVDLYGTVLSTSYDATGTINGTVPTKYLTLNTKLPEIGDKVFAIGSPLGLENTVSEGIVSGIRNINGMQYIQHTAYTDHGSSGGCLFDEYGEVIGVTSAKVDKSNLEFAIPALYVQQELDKLKNKNK